MSALQVWFKCLMTGAGQRRGRASRGFVLLGEAMLLQLLTGPECTCTVLLLSHRAHPVRVQQPGAFLPSKFWEKEVVSCCALASCLDDTTLTFDKIASSQKACRSGLSKAPFRTLFLWPLFLSFGSKCILCMLLNIYIKCILCILINIYIINIYIIIYMLKLYLFVSLRYI